MVINPIQAIAPFHIETSYYIENEMAGFCMKYNIGMQ